jgi:hypothetical protein
MATERRDEDRGRRLPEWLAATVIGAAILLVAIGAFWGFSSPGDSGGAVNPQAQPPARVQPQPPVDPAAPAERAAPTPTPRPDMGGGTR